MADALVDVISGFWNERIPTACRYVAYGKAAFEAEVQAADTEGNEASP